MTLGRQHAIHSVLVTNQSSMVVFSRLESEANSSKPSDTGRYCLNLYKNNKKHVQNGFQRCTLMNTTQISIEFSELEAREHERPGELTCLCASLR